MTSWIWKAVKLIVAASCGAVVLLGPSEVDRLAVGEAAGRAAALAMLSLIALGSLAAAVAPARCVRHRVCGLRIAGFTLITYGMYAIAVKHLVALPTGGLAVGVGLLFIDRAATLAVMREEDRR